MAGESHPTPIVLGRSFRGGREIVSPTADHRPDLNLQTGAEDSPGRLHPKPRPAPFHTHQHHVRAETVRDATPSGRQTNKHTENSQLL